MNPAAAGTAADLTGQAAALRALHRPGSPLVLPNAWDAVSARAVAEAGFPVVATTSSGVAASLGYPDGHGTPERAMFDAVARIAAAVDVPVTADVEGGYGLDPDTLVTRLVGAGVVGMNLEDSDHDHPGTLLDVREQADRIAAVRAAARTAGIDLVINARVDVFLRRPRGPLAEQVAESVRRGAAYRAAGADCVYPIMLADGDAIAALAAEVGPLNVLLTPRTPGLARLAELGVARVSLGGGLHAHVTAALRAALDRLRAGQLPG